MHLRPLAVACLCGAALLAACNRADSPPPTDLTRSTSSSGGSNLPQPPSTDNPPQDPGALRGTTGAGPQASQAMSSNATGTSPMPTSDTLPKAGQGGTNAGGSSR